MRKTQETKLKSGSEIGTRIFGRIDRRSFVKFIPALGAAGLAASSLPLRTTAQTPTPSPSPSPAPPKPSPLAEAYTEVARLRFGEHLTPAQLEQVKKDMEGNVGTADRLRGFKLQNGDEPDFIFTA